jgi:hypothetical protein
MNFLQEKKYGVPSHNFVKKNVLCEKGDEITRVDGIYMASQHKIHITSMKSQTENVVSHQMILSARDSQIILAAITVVSVRLAVKNHPLSEV